MDRGKWIYDLERGGERKRGWKVIEKSSRRCFTLSAVEPADDSTRENWSTVSIAFIYVKRKLLLNWIRRFRDSRLADDASFVFERNCAKKSVAEQREKCIFRGGLAKARDQLDPFLPPFSRSFVLTALLRHHLPRWSRLSLTHHFVSFQSVSAILAIQPRIQEQVRTSTSSFFFSSILLLQFKNG